MPTFLHQLHEHGVGLPQPVMDMINAKQASEGGPTHGHG
jgi:hypothetical protein